MSPDQELELWRDERRRNWCGDVRDDVIVYLPAPMLTPRSCKIVSFGQGRDVFVAFSNGVLNWAKLSDTYPDAQSAAARYLDIWMGRVNDELDQLRRKVADLENRRSAT